ncbi:hypothetical protein AVEN_259866-1 [Araneus ventricosus]|uniref:Uncharacterized protein n=1 Tax=Araneus ventricosus TaxID=182803 RepID=A0A4Y2BEV8_ARAVE|nr:hypothetical protein AVEN_223909-1 [Araneus ventricosus]GBM19282.1 hypothetical protein AVEN_259866-1 [Araneus ventricosus]
MTSMTEIEIRDGIHPFSNIHLKLKSNLNLQQSIKSYAGKSHFTNLPINGEQTDQFITRIKATKLDFVMQSFFIYIYGYLKPHLLHKRVKEKNRTLPGIAYEVVAPESFR